MGAASSVFGELFGAGVVGLVCVSVTSSRGTVSTSVEGGAGDRLGRAGLRGTSELLKNSAKLFQEASWVRERSYSLSSLF